MNDVTAGYKIIISRMPILTTFSLFVDPDRTVLRCDCREKLLLMKIFISYDCYVITFAFQSSTLFREIPYQQIAQV